MAMPRSNVRCKQLRRFSFYFACHMTLACPTGSMGMHMAAAAFFFISSAPSAHPRELALELRR